MQSSQNGSSKTNFQQRKDVAKCKENPGISLTRAVYI